MAQLQSLLPEFLMHAPGCPEPLAFRTLNAAARRFCRATNILVQRTAPLEVSPGTVVLDLQDGLDGAVEAVHVKFAFTADGAPLGIVNRRLPPGVHAPTFMYRTDSQSIEFITPPTERMSVVFDVSVCPKESMEGSSTLHDDLTGRWADAVVHNALASVCAMPAQPFTSAEQAARSGAIYAMERGKARIEANLAYDGVVAVAMNPFA